MKKLLIIPGLLAALLSAWGGAMLIYHLSYSRDGKTVSDHEMPSLIKQISYDCDLASVDWRANFLPVMEAAQALRSDHEYFIEVGPKGSFQRLHVRNITGRLISHIALNPDGTISRLANQPFPGESLMPRPCPLMNPLTH